MKRKVELILLLISLLGNIYLARVLSSVESKFPHVENGAPVDSSLEKSPVEREPDDRKVNFKKMTERTSEPNSASTDKAKVIEAPDSSNIALFAGYEYSSKVQSEFQPTGDPVADITKYLSSSSSVLPTVEMARAYLKEERSAEQRSYYFENLGRADLPGATEILIKLYSDEAPTELQTSWCAAALVARNSDLTKTTLTHYFENSGDSNPYTKVEIAMHLVEKYDDSEANVFLRDMLQNTTDDFHRQIIEIFYRRRGQK